MGDLAAETAIAPVPGAEGRYTGTLSKDWEIWGPMGGYVAAFALRAAGRHCGLPRPASLVGHYLGVARFEAPLEIACETLRSAKTAQSVRARITQEGRPIFDALVWGAADGLRGLEHAFAPMPEVPHWSALPTIQERMAERGETWEAWYPFWNNLAQRPPEWDARWMERKAGERDPIWRQWLRFQPTASFPGDPWVDACRLLVLVDLGSWPAAQATHNQDALIAPSIDLACAFHRLRPESEWLLAQGVSPAAASGLVASQQHVWSDRGELLASGISQLLCRPSPSARG